MSERVSGIALQDLDRAAGLARSLEHADALGALCYDVLGRQAEGRSLFTGAEFVSGRAKAHAVTKANAETPLGNLLTLLKRGPESNLERALIAALFVLGFSKTVGARPDERKTLCTKLAMHCDWLELSSPYRVLPLVDLMLEPELAGDVLAALALLVLAEDAATSAPAVRARNAGRITALSQSSVPAARGLLEKIVSEAHDGCSAALASLGLGRPSSVPPRGRAYEVHGSIGRFPHGFFRSLLRWVTGFALLSWALRVVLFAVGYRRDAEVALTGGALRVRSQTALLGRVARNSEQVHALSSVRSAQRAARYASLPLVLGAGFFALGVLLGGLFAFDAARVGDRALWLAAAAFLLAGSGLDLLLEVLVPGHRGRVVLDLDLGRGQGVRLSDVPIEEADRFLNELANTLSTAQGARRGVA